MPKPPDFWSALSRPFQPAAFTADWQRLWGTDFAAVRRFLRPCGISMYWKCPECPHPHQVRCDPGGAFLGVPYDDSCKYVRLTKEDVTLYQLDTNALLSFIASALSLSGKLESVVGAPFTWLLGVATNKAGVSTPVYLSLAHSSGLLNLSIAAMKQEYGDSFCLLSPTDANVPARVITALRKAQHRFFILSDLIKVDPGPTWVNLQPPSVLAGDSAPEKTKEHPYIFEPHPAGWRIVFNHSKEMFLPDDLFGPRYLDYLLHHPGELINAIDLEAIVQVEKKGLRQQGQLNDPSQRKAAYNLISEKRTLVAKADKLRDEGRISEAEEYSERIQELEDAIKSCLDHKNDDEKKSSENIRKAIYTATCNLKKYPHSKEFLLHLKISLNKGRELLYHTPQGFTWR